MSEKAEKLLEQILNELKTINTRTAEVEETGREKMAAAEQEQKRLSDLLFGALKGFGNGN